MEEIWVDIKGYEGFYQVSNQGRVRSVEREIIRNGRTTKLKGRVLKQNVDSKGYLCVNLSKENKTKTVRVHRLIAIAFIPNPENKPYIDHINTIRTDNRIENLRWATIEENANNPLSVEKQIGENNHRYGKKCPEELKEKLSIMFTGEGNPNYGKHHSKETKEKISKKIKKKKVVQLSLYGEFIKIWDSTRETDKEGYNHTRVIICCKDNTRTHKGYKWMYYEDYIKLNEEKGE